MTYRPNEPFNNNLNNQNYANNGYGNNGVYDNTNIQMGQPVFLSPNTNANNGYAPPNYNGQSNFNGQQSLNGQPNFNGQQNQFVS